MDKVKNTHRNSSAGYGWDEIKGVPEKGDQFDNIDKIKFRRPNGTEFVVTNVPEDWTVGRLYGHVTRFNRYDLRSMFFCDKFEYEMSIGGTIYAADTKLFEVCQVKNTSDFGCVEFVESSIKIAKDRLNRQTGMVWKITFDGRLEYECDKFSSEQEILDSHDNLFKILPRLKNLCQVSVDKIKNYSGDWRGNVYEGWRATIIVKGDHAIKMIAEEEIFEIKNAAPVIAQALRNSAGMDLGAMPLEVLARLGAFLAPEISPVDAQELMQDKINAANREYQEAPTFTKLKPVKAGGVRKSIGATAYRLLNGKNTGDACNANPRSIANIEFSNAGMTLEFHDKDYAKRFASALDNEGYVSGSYAEVETQTEYGDYHANVCISNMHEMKMFIEQTCGYPSVYTRDLFRSGGNDVVLAPDFFVDQLKLIGKSPVFSASAKKAKAKALMADFLGYLDPAGARRLRELIMVLSRPNSRTDGEPLQFLRENTGVGRLLPGDLYSDKVGTYKQILAELDEVIAKAAE